MKEFSFTIDIDAKSYVVKEVHVKITYEKSGDENQADYQYTYKAYDEWDEIEKVELHEDEIDLFETDEASDFLNACNTCPRELSQGENLTEEETIVDEKKYGR